MKKLIYLLLALFCVSGMAQPTLTTSDMPSAGDNIRTRSSLGIGLNYQVTGNNYTWDFSSLSSTGTGADTFVSVSSTSLVYQLVFNLPFDPNKANLASPQPDFNLVPGIPLSNIVNFYKNTATSYAMCGFGAEVAGVPLPIKFNALEHLYRFPLSANSPKDSSSVSFAQGIPGIGYLSIQKKRVNEVDGWGTVITPAGSYNVLRMKSIVNEIDSIYLDSLSFGIAIPRNYTEYKWLANGKGIPVLEVSDMNLVPTFTWIDSSAVSNPFSVSLGPGQSICQGNSVQLTATPSGGTPPYYYLWSNFSLGQSITVSPGSSTTYSVTVTDAAFQIVTATIAITVLPEPNVLITKLPDLLVGCSGGLSITEFQLTATPGFSSYSWYNGASSQSITTGPPYTGFEGIYDYWVEVVDNQGCIGKDTLSILWEVCLSIENQAMIQAGNSLKLYPNPANDKVFVSNASSEEIRAEVRVYNSVGQQQGEATSLQISSGARQTLFGVRELALRPGLFFIRFSTAKESCLVPLLVE